MKENYQTKSNTLIFIAIIMMAIAFFSLYFSKTPPNVNKTDTVYVSDTIYKDTTLTIFKEKPVVKEVYLTKVDTFYTSEGKDTILKTESKLYQDTLCCKNDSIILKNYISGVNPTLDSIKADWRKQETIITNTVEITKYIEKKRTFLDRFSIGIGVGYGIGLNNKQFEPFIGVSFNYNLHF